MEVLRQRLTYPDLKRRVIEQARSYRANSLIIEDKATGTALIYDLRHETSEGLPYPIAYVPESDKVTRMHSQSAKIEAGHVYLPRRASWLEDFRIELLQFPKGKHDDQVDSMSQFLNWLEQRNRNRWTVEPLNI